MTLESLRLRFPPDHCGPAQRTRSTPQRNSHVDVPHVILEQAPSQWQPGYGLTQSKLLLVGLSRHDQIRINF